MSVSDPDFEHACPQILLKSTIILKLKFKLPYQWMYVGRDKTLKISKSKENKF